MQSERFTQKPLSPITRHRIAHSTASPNTKPAVFELIWPNNKNSKRMSPPLALLKKLLNIRA